MWIKTKEKETKINKNKKTIKIKGGTERNNKIIKIAEVKFARLFS